MNALVYIACCMAISFFVGLVMGMRVGYVAGMDVAEQERQLLARKYNELVGILRTKEAGR